MTILQDASSIASADRSAWFRLTPPMRPGSVPVLGGRYWVAISLASIAGCNLGDFVSLYLRLGHWLGLIPLALIFALLVFGERRSRRASEAWYWAAIIVLRTAATNLADLASHTFHIEYAWVIACLEMVQVLAVLLVMPRPVAKGRGAVVRPVADGWYWVSMLTAGTLGTAIGDCTAEVFKLGTAYGTLTLSAILAVVLALGAKSRWSTKAAYWFAIIAVRSAGTTAGDFVAFTDGLGLGLGLPLATACTCGLFVAVLLLWRPKSLDAPGAAAH